MEASGPGQVRMVVQGRLDVNGCVPLWQKARQYLNTSQPKVLGVEAEPLQLTIIVSIVVIANAGLSTLLERRGFGPTAALRQFVFTGLLNLGIVAVLGLVYRVAGSPFDLTTAFVYLLLITLLVTLYDRYRPEYVARFAKSDKAAPATT